MFGQTTIVTSSWGWTLIKRPQSNTDNFAEAFYYFAFTISIIRQVAHDLESPLGALNTVASTNMSSDQINLIRMITERIKSITNDLDHIYDLEQRSEAIEINNAIEKNNY